MKKCKICLSTDRELSDEGLCFGCVHKQRDRLEGALFMALQMNTKKSNEQAQEFIDKIKSLKD